MAQQTINLGTVANDGTGDTLRDGGDRINDNFTELYGADAANLKSANNLSDVADAATARANLDVYSTGEVDALVGGGGGATTLDDLTDVDTSTVPPTDGQALVWDDADSLWVPGTVSGGGAVAVDDEGTEVVSTVARLNFTGSGVTVTDLGSGEVEINISGSGGGSMPTIVQTKAVAKANLSTGITMDAAPTNGSVLVAVAFSSGGAAVLTAASGWTTLQSSTSATTNNVTYWRVAGAGESATQTPTTNTTSGLIIIYEIAGASSASMVSASTTATATLVSCGVSYTGNGSYLKNVAGLGITIGMRKEASTATPTGSFATVDDSVQDASAITGVNMMIAGASNTFALNSSLTGNWTWATSVASAGNFIVVN